MNSNPNFKDQTFLITGGTGSFGRALAKHLLQENQCRKVIIFSRDEWKQWEMQRSDPIFAHPKIRYFLGDVRDLPRLQRAFSEVDFVIHAAALKQVPAAEYNPSEFVKTNVIGAMNIIDAAITKGVKKVVALSTDKACNPVNLYGATKLCSDKLFVNGNAYVGAKGHPTFSVVRYGNVLNSRGSIIPLWCQAIKEGTKSLTITDKRMTRFWITIEEAVSFVLKSLTIMTGGEIFVPKIPSMRIIDLAEAVAPNIPHEICGIREGEKLHEMMICTEDARHTLEFDEFFIIIPEQFSHDNAHIKLFKEQHMGGKQLPEGFAYTSDSNSRWLKADELRPVIRSYLS